jgi:hypothetical protein
VGGIEPGDVCLLRLAVCNLTGPMV